METRSQSALTRKRKELEKNLPGTAAEETLHHSSIDKNVDGESKKSPLTLPPSSPLTSTTSIPHVTWLKKVSQHQAKSFREDKFTKKSGEITTMNYFLSIQYHKDQIRKQIGEVINGTQFPLEATIIAAKNGFLNSIIEAYTDHHDLILRPDDVWLAIMIQFSFYVNGNAEKLRSKFVAHKGKNTLFVYCAGFIRDFPYAELIPKFEKLIHENLIDKTFMDWITPCFSTTTPEDKIISGILFMATMKQYFRYLAGGCGIPNVGLHGTLEDWKDIRNRLEKFEEYPDLKKWKSLLVKILDNMILTKVGVISSELKDFWNEICYYQPGSSGTEDIFTGWSSVFAYFNKNGKPNAKVGPGEWPKLTTNNVPIGVVEVDLDLIDPHGSYQSTLYAGFIGKEVFGDKKNGIKPVAGWAIALKE